MSQPAGQLATLLIVVTGCSMSEVLETLLTSAVIKREKDSRTISVHRLVQTQYMFHISAAERLQALSAAADLLWAAFPSADGNRGQLYDRWEQCHLYLQHVLSLRDKYQVEMQGPDKDKVTPSFKFPDLLNSTTR